MKINSIKKKLAVGFSNEKLLAACKEKNLKPASVLVPIFNENSTLNILLTKRTEHLANHASQVCFPGGGIEDQDLDLLATAFRETNEEIGLDQHQFDILGFLQPRETVSGYLMLPVVVELHTPFELSINPEEIEKVITAPLDHFMDPHNYSIGEVTLNGALRRFHKIYINNDLIWGVTADILHEIFAI